MCFFVQLTSSGKQVVLSPTFLDWLLVHMVPPMSDSMAARNMLASASASTVAAAAGGWPRTAMAVAVLLCLYSLRLAIALDCEGLLSEQLAEVSITVC